MKMFPFRDTARSSRRFFACPAPNFDQILAATNELAGLFSGVHIKLSPLDGDESSCRNFGRGVLTFGEILAKKGTSC